MTRAWGSVVEPRGSLGRLSFARFPGGAAPAGSSWAASAVRSAALRAFSASSARRFSVTASASRTRRSRSAAARCRLTPAGGGALQLGPSVAPRRFRLAPAFLQRRLAPERGRPGRGAHPHPILRDPVQAGHPGPDQGGEAVDQELFQYLAVADAEVGQRLGIHTDAAAQPLVGDVLVA